MVHFTSNQFAEIRRRYLALTDKANEKGLQFNISISLYERKNDDDAFDNVTVMMKSGNEEGFVFYESICSASNVDNTEWGRNYDRTHLHGWNGVIAAFEKAEAFINER